jgi:hypothetical protein
MKMKILLLALPLLVACSSPTSPTSDAPEAAAPAALDPNAIVDAQNGYGAHHLGDSLSSFKGVPLKLVPRIWPAVMYIIPSHNEHLDTLRLDGLGYEFWQGRLYRINFNSRRPGLLEAGKRMYGQGVQVSPTEHRWQGQRASADFTVRNTTNGKVTYLRISDNAAAAQVDSAVAALRPE